MMDNMKADKIEINLKRRRWGRSEKWQADEKKQMMKKGNKWFEIDLSMKKQNRTECLKKQNWNNCENKRKLYRKVHDVCGSCEQMWKNQEKTRMNWTVNEWKEIKTDLIRKNKKACDERAWLEKEGLKGNKWFETGNNENGTVKGRPPNQRIIAEHEKRQKMNKTHTHTRTNGSLQHAENRTFICLIKVQGNNIKLN
jgi:hypothetical protein